MIGGQDMNPVLAANQADLEECCNAVIELLGRLDDDSLNWKPAVSDTNSIAGLVIHSMSALIRWLARGAGAELPLIDRSGDFIRQSTATELVALIGTSLVETRARLIEIDGLNGSDSIMAHRAHGPSHTVTRAWCVTHAIGHVREHWGAIQLTAQLYAVRAKTRRSQLESLRRLKSPI